MLAFLRTPNSKSKLEIIVNASIVAVAIVTLIVFAKNYLRPKDNTNLLESVVGTKPQLDDIDWAKNKQTILLVLQRGCHFCTESAPFYSRLSEEVNASKDVQLLAVLPQSIAEGQEYLKGMNLAITDVRQAPPTSLGARGTPTVFWVNQGGVVTNVWSGKLPAEKESEILAKVRQCSVSANCT